jgi:hypothetical protein
VYHIDRGYERIEERLASLGAVIRREDDREETAESALLRGALNAG